MRRFEQRWTRALSGRFTWAVALSAPVLLLACSRLLGYHDEDPHRGFEHREHATEGVACFECHEGITTAPDHGPLHLPDDDRCVECHEEPHDPSPCQRCHSGRNVRSRIESTKHYIRFSHDQHRAEVRGQCVGCHSGVSEVAGTRLAAPMAACLTCHEHRDQIQIRDCEACHTNLREELPLPESHIIHEGDFLRRHGTVAASAGDLCASCHSESTCAGCHGVTVAALPSRMGFDQVGRATMHRANFIAHHSRDARLDPGLCTTCHSESSCRACHTERGLAPSGAEPRLQNPHPPDWVSAGPGGNLHGPAARRDPVACASCHSGAGEALCLECHRVGGIGGNPHPPGWVSERSLQQRPCSACHVP